MGDAAQADERTAVERTTLRSQGRAWRRGVVGDARQRAEAALAAHAASLAFEPGALIGVYIGDDGEPNLDALVTVLRGRGHDIALPVPAADADDFTMEFQPWRESDTLTPGRFGIPCPPPRTAVEPAAVFVPLVRFDAAGNRMGRGAGFYDRWLSVHRALAIGTAFEGQRADHLTPQPHDVAMHAIVTELGIRLVLPTGAP